MRSFKKIIALFRRHERFLITTHQNPDADAAASALAVAGLLKTLGKKVKVVNHDPLPDWLGFLPYAQLFQQSAKVKSYDYDVAIVLDCGDLKRIGDAQKLLREDKPLINIDHHVTNAGFGSISLVEAQSSSTCEIIFELLKAARVPLTKQLATLVYAGIMTDTGSFRFENTSARTHAITSALMALGLNAADLYQKLYVGIPVKDMVHFIELVHNAKLLLNNRVFCVLLSQKALAKFSKSFDLKERLFGFLRSIKGVEVVVILTQVSATETRLNLRSQGDFDVAQLAMEFNGGGHVKAAGGKIDENMQKAQQLVVAAIKRRMGK